MMHKVLAQFSKDQIRFDGYMHFAKMPAVNTYIYGGEPPNPRDYIGNEHYQRTFNLLFEIQYQLIADTEKGQSELSDNPSRLQLLAGTLTRLQKLALTLKASGHGITLYTPHPSSAFYQMSKEMQAQFLPHIDAKIACPEGEEVPPDVVVAFDKAFPQDAYFRSGHQVIECLSMLVNPLLASQTRAFEEQTPSSDVLAIQTDSLVILEEISNCMIFLRDLDLGTYLNYRQHLRGTSGGASVNLRWAFATLLRVPHKMAEIQKDTGLSLFDNHEGSKAKKMSLPYQEAYDDCLSKHPDAHPSDERRAFFHQWLIQVEEMMCAFFTHHSLAVMALGSDTGGTMSKVVGQLTAKHTLAKHPTVLSGSKELRGPRPIGYAGTVAGTGTLKTKECQAKGKPLNESASLLTTNLDQLYIELSTALSETKKARLLAKDPERNSAAIQACLKGTDQVQRRANHIFDSLERFIQFSAAEAPMSISDFLTNIITHKHPRSEEFLNLFKLVNDLEMQVLSLKYRLEMIHLATGRPYIDPPVTRALTQVDRVMATLAQEAADRLGTDEFSCETVNGLGCRIMAPWPEAQAFFFPQ